MKRCAASGKRKFRSAADAYIYAALRKPRRADWQVMRAYRCPDCDFWHLTRRDKSQAAA